MPIPRRIKVKVPVWNSLAGKHDYIEQDEPALFLGWGVMPVGGEGGSISSAAVVEFDDGRVELFEPHLIRFDPPLLGNNDKKGA